MNADIKGALNQINQSYKAFVHRGQPMTRKEVEAVLKYALLKGYKTTNELSGEEVDKILNQIKK